MSTETLPDPPPWPPSHVPVDDPVDPEVLRSELARDKEQLDFWLAKIKHAEWMVSHHRQRIIILQNRLHAAMATVRAIERIQRQR